MAEAEADPGAWLRSATSVPTCTSPNSGLGEFLFEIWTPEANPARPTPNPGMFYGPIGEFALAAAEHTEADAVAILAQGLTAFGVTLNRTAYVRAGDDRHPAALFALIVGTTSKGGKGTSWAVTRDFVSHVNPDLIERRRVGGFGSGEAIVAELASTDENASA